MATLTVSLPTQSGERVIELDGDEISIGRDESNAIVLADNATSRSHAVVRRTAGGWIVADAGSRNGTWVAGVKVSEHRLVDGDEIRIGKAVVTFSDPPDPQATVLMDVSAYREEAEADPHTAAMNLPARAVPPSPSPPPARPPEPTPPTPSTPSTPSTPPTPPPAMRPQAPPRPPTRPTSPPPAPPAPAPRPVVAPQPPSADPQPASAPHLAGFGIRLAAYVVDGLILGVVFGAMSLVVALIIPAVAPNSPGVAVALSVVAYLLVSLVSIAYLALFWSRSGATPGKRVFGLRVVRTDGVHPVGLGRALLRVLGYMVSSMTLCIGFLMVAFSQRRQGLHDIIAGTLVIRG